MIAYGYVYRIVHTNNAWLEILNNQMACKAGGLQKATFTDDKIHLALKCTHQLWAILDNATSYTTSEISSHFIEMWQSKNSDIFV